MAASSESVTIPRHRSAIRCRNWGVPAEGRALVWERVPGSKGDGLTDRCGTGALRGAREGDVVEGGAATPGVDACFAQAVNTSPKTRAVRPKRSRRRLAVSVPFGPALAESPWAKAANARDGMQVAPSLMARLLPRGVIGRLPGEPSSGQLTLEVEPASPEPPTLPLVPWHHPEDLELVSIRISRIEAQAVAMVGFALQRPRIEQRLPGLSQVGEALHLPGQVVQADTIAPAGKWRARADAEQPQVVVVVAAVRAKEQRLLAHGL